MRSTFHVYFGIAGAKLHPVAGRSHTIMNEWLMSPIQTRGSPTPLVLPDNLNALSLHIDHSRIKKDNYYYYYY